MHEVGQVGGRFPQLQRISIAHHAKQRIGAQVLMYVFGSDGAVHNLVLDHRISTGAGRDPFRACHQPSQSIF